MANPQAGIPPQIQQEVAKFQQIQQQLQAVTSQKMQYGMTLCETKSSPEEINAAGDDVVVFSSAGSILIQKKKETVSTELQEKIDSLELRIGSLDKQEKTMATKASQLQKQIQDAVAGAGSIPTAE